MLENLLTLRSSSDRRRRRRDLTSRSEPSEALEGLLDFARGLLRILLGSLECLGSYAFCWALHERPIGASTHPSLNTYNLMLVRH